MISRVSDSHHLLVYQINRNLAKVSYLALAIIASSMLSIAHGGLVSYTACIATCPAMAAASPPGLFQYTFEACMTACNWMLSPTCP